MPSTADGAQPISSKRRLELLVDALTDHAIYMLDAEGFVTLWNRGAERLTGWSAGEIVGQPFWRFFTPEDRSNRLPERILASARVGGRHEAEGWRVRKDGSRFWSNAILQRVADDSGTLLGFAEITRDRTERQAAQQALMESERRFRLLVDGIVDHAIYLLDASGIVTNWNSGAQRMKGWTADEIVGQHFSRFYTREERATGLPARVLDAAAREGRYEGEGWRLRKDGSRFWATVVVDAIRNSAGELEGFAKVTRDITERRAAHEALRDSEQQFRLLVTNVTDYALYMLDPNGIVASWNAGAQRIKGYAADEIVGQHFSRFYTERDRAAGLPARALQMAAAEGRFEAEAWRVRQDGSLFWANVVMDPVRDEAGHLIGFAKITRDISERRSAELALQEAQAQRAHAQKMDALGQLTGGVAHDFNNLLMIVSGHLQAIKPKAAGDARAERSAEAIEMAVRRGASLTRQLLSFSRRQPTNPTIVHLGEHVRGFRDMMRNSIGPEVRLITAIDPQAWPVKVDANELELALVNLGLNARDALTDGGAITVSSENVTLVVGDTPAGIAGPFVALRINDTGSGIAPDVLPKVFDPFFTTKEVGKGTGLGLSQVHGFAHQSGGTVTIDSALGGGTTVTLYLPRAEDAAPHATAAPQRETTQSGTVLLVEDNPDVAQVTMLMLEELGYAVKAVGSAVSALAALDKNDVDLVISDIAMPGGMNGLALARVLRELKPALPVLLVSGYSDLAAQAGSEFTLLRKPFDRAELSRTTARMIAEAGQPPGANIVRLRNTRPGPKHEPPR
jgi:PAS domain S-box-containing protein